MVIAVAAVMPGILVVVPVVIAIIVTLVRSNDATGHE